MASWASIARRVRVPLGFLFAVLFFWLARPSLISILAGAVLVVAGVTIRALASGHVRKNEQLATTGPYAYTRNPLYLGSLIMASGFAVAARSWWIAAGMLLFFLVIYLPVIRGEEEFLRARFPEFAEYERTVPRLFPRLSGPADSRRGEPRSQTSTEGFAWSLYLQHREYNASIGAGAMLMALVVKLLWFNSPWGR